MAYFEWQKSDSGYFVDVNFIQLTDDLNFGDYGQEVETVHIHDANDAHYCAVIDSSDRV